MRVFISWSGERSRAIAEALRTWLPRVIQSVRPWMSQEDISAGSRWLAEVSSVLDTAQVGLLCVTPENQHNPWLVFEAGALSKSLDQSRVCPMLFDMSPGQLSGPVTQFQAHVLNKQGVLRVLSALNDGLDEAKLPVPELAEILEVWWPQLERQLEAIGPAPAPTVARSVQEQLDELLSLNREQLRRENLRLEAVGTKDAHLEKMMQVIDDSFAEISNLQKSARKMQGSVRDAFSVILDKVNSQEVTAGDAIRQMIEVSMPGADSAMKIDLGALKQMRGFLEEFEREHRDHVQQMLSPPEAGEPAR